MNSNIPRHAIWRPGMTWDKVGELDADTRHAATAGASNAEARLRDMDAMGIDQALLYPTWFAEGFHLVEDPDVAYALARAYNDWIADFCKAAPDQAVRRVDGSAAEHRLCRRGTSPHCKDLVLPRGVHSTVKSRGPLLHSSDSRSAMGGAGEPRHDLRGASSGRDVESGVDLARSVLRKDKDPAAPSFVHDCGRRRTCRWRWIGYSVRFHRVAAARPSDRSGHCAVARQSYVRRVDADWIHRDAALSQYENGGRARQGFVDGGSARRR